MFHSNAILVSGLMILIVSNLSECKNRSVLNKEPRVWSFDKQVTCSLCAKDCEHTPKSREERSVSLDSIELDKRLKRMDVQSSIRTLLSRLRPETPLAAFGYTPPPPYSQTSYAPIANAYSYPGYRPALSNLGVNYGLDIAPGYSDFTPYISTGLGSNLGTPYGTGLGIGSSFGIYDNFYPNSFGTSKSTMLRRKLVPQEGVLLLEVEDPLSDPRETLPLTSGRHIGKVPLNRHGNNHPTNFGPPKFSIQLTNSPNELNSDDSNRNLAFYSNMLGGLTGDLPTIQSTKQLKPNLSNENLANLEELSRNPHLSKLDRKTNQKNQKIRILT